MAVSKLAFLYIDVRKFAFAEIDGKQLVSGFKAITAATQQESVTWADLPFSLKDAMTQSPMYDQLLNYSTIGILLIIVVLI